jgi:hypothetical protein
MESICIGAVHTTAVVSAVPENSKQVRGVRGCAMVSDRI